MTFCRILEEYHPWWSLLKDREGQLMFSQGRSIPARRQDLPPAYHREGSVYVTRQRVLMEDGSLYGKKLARWAVSRDETVNLDSEQDWRRAEQMLWMDPVAK